MRRKTARILLINDKQEILLFKTKEGQTIARRKGAFWFTPGGGIEENEDFIKAALRELFEETALVEKDLKIGPIVWHDQSLLSFQGKNIIQSQQYIVIQTNNSNISFENFTKKEKQYIEKSTWFSYEDLLSCKEIIYPKDLPKYIKPILEKKYPKKPIEVTF